MFQRLAPLTLALAVFALPNAMADGPRPLIIATNEGISEPLLIRGAKTPQGLTPDIAQALAQTLQRPLRFQLLSRKRLEYALQTGEIDGICLIVPQHLTLSMADLRWTPVLHSITEQLVSLPGAPPIQQLEQLHGQTIGTILGYRYPLLDKAFQQGQIQRDDAPTEALNLRKLQEGRFRHIIWKSDAVLWHNKTQPPTSKLQRSPLIIEKVDSRCVFTAQSGISESQLQEATKQLEKSGALLAIRARYR